MLHFRWVSFNGIQRVCDNQDFVETEQLKAYSRVLEIHVQLICSAKMGKYFIALSSWAELTTTICFVYKLRWDVQGMLQVHFLLKNALHKDLAHIKNYFTSMNCPYKSRPLFLKKIHFKKLRKTMKKKCYRKKKKKKLNQNLPRKTSNVYKVDYKIQDTDGFHRIHVPL